MRVSSFGELYDRNKDPDEFVNLWDDPDYQDVKRTSDPETA